jgi:type IV secretion system protein TrbE
MSLHIPDGYFVEDHICFGDPGKGCILVKGYNVYFPDLSGSDDSVYSELESIIRLMLASLKHDERLQLHFYTSNDFGSSLDRFENDTKSCSIDIAKDVRTEIAHRFRTRIEERTLVQTNLRLYLSCKIPRLVSSSGRSTFKEMFRVVKRSFEQRASFFEFLLKGQSGRIQPLNNSDNYAELLRFWSPGTKPQTQDINWLRSIEDLCRFSDIAPRLNSECGFMLDGHAVGIMAFKSLPRSTWIRTMDPFFALAIPGIRVVLNMEPLPVEGEIRYEEDRFGKLISNLDPRSPNLQSEVGLDKHRDRMRRLLSNQSWPFQAQFIAIGHDKVRENLDVKMESLRAAIGKTGAECYQAQLPTAAISFFNCAMPGFGPWVSYKDYRHKIDDINLADLWPARSTSKGDLDQADWLCDGDQNNLIGGTLFSGQQPLHLFCAATTGAGKSVLLQSIALQSAPRLKFMAVIDDGLSWMTTCSKLDPSCRPIVIRSNGAQTFNPFDTRGLPLASQHLASATALCHLLVGQHSDSDKDKLRAAVLSEAIMKLYASAYQAWCAANPKAHYNLCLQTQRILDFQARHGFETFLDAYLESRNRLEDAVDETKAVALEKDPRAAYLVQNLAFASWRPALFPSLSDLQEQLNYANGIHKELCATLASLLRPWLRDGRYGPVVDGVSNVDLGSAQVDESDRLKVVYFELGALAEAEAELRAVAGFLITNELRNHIQGMPRGIRKQVVIEEMVSFLKVPNAKEIVTDYYSKMRKYCCQVTSVFQNYATLLEASPKVAKAIVSNSSAMLLLRNHNRHDLDQLGEFMPRPLPENIKDQITRFPKPSELDAKNAHAGFVYVRLDQEEPRYTIGRNYISTAVERITSSTGAVFEEKLRELAINKHNKEGTK